MKIRFVYYLLLFAVMLPAMFSCSTTREYYSFGPATGKFHGATAEKTSDKVAAKSEVGALRQANVTSAATAPEMAATASVNPEPAPELTSVDSRLQAATAEAQKASVSLQNNAKTRLSLVEKIALKKVQKALKKAGEKQAKATHPDMVKKPMLDMNLKLALVFLLAALIAGLFNGLVAAVLVIIALVFLILWVLTL